MFLKDCVEAHSTKTEKVFVNRTSLVDCARLATRYLCLCFIIKNERRALAKLTDMELQDIGLHRAEVNAEYKRSFFDVPADRWNMLLKTPDKPD